MNPILWLNAAFLLGVLISVVLCFVHALSKKRRYGLMLVSSSFLLVGELAFVAVNVLQGRNRLVVIGLCMSLTTLWCWVVFYRWLSKSKED